MAENIFIAVVLVAFTLVLPFGVRRWRTAERDEDEGYGIPTRSMIPFYGGVVVGADIAALTLLLPSGSTAATVGFYLALIVIGAGLLLASTTGFFRWPRWALPPKIRQPARVKHDLAVYHVDEQHAGSSGAYYVALCSCGWDGDIFPSQVQADHQARKHQPLIDPALREFRPGKNWDRALEAATRAEPRE